MTNPANFPAYTIAGNGVEIPFNTGTADANGSYWYMDGEMAGWDSPDGRVTMLTKIGKGPNADGEYPADQHYRGRTLTFSIHFSSSSEALREASRYLLAQALDLVDAVGTLTVQEAIPKFVTISRSGNNNQGKLTITDMGLSAKAVSTPGFPTADPEESTGNVYVCKAQVEIYCEDPRKYAVSTIAGAFGDIDLTGPQWGIVLDNPGNTATQDVQVALTGPEAGTAQFFGIGGGTFLGELILAVPTTPGPALPGFPSALDIDLYQQTIEDDAGNNFYYLRNLQAGGWPYVGAGLGQVILLDGLVGVAGSLTYRPAWI